MKTLLDYVFMSDCLLGSTTTPAYSGTAKAISLSEQELMVADALSQDILSNGLSNINLKKEDTTLKDDKNIETSTEEAIVEPVVDGKNTVISENETHDIQLEPEVSGTEEHKNTDTAALTAYDLRRKVTEACRAKFGDWCWVSYLFPEDHEVWCEYDGETELDYLKFTYTVENDVVTVSEPENVKLSVSVKTINDTIAEYEKTISEKDDLIVQSSSEITALKSENSELAQYKEKFDQIQQEKIVAELKQKKEDLIASVVKSGQITREEIEASEELSGYVDNLDKKSLMAIVGERVSASLTNRANKNVETSEVESGIHISSNLNNEDDANVDKASIMRHFLKK